MLNNKRPLGLNHSERTRLLSNAAESEQLSMALLCVDP